MKTSIFTRIGILVFSLITALCLLFIALTYLSTSHFHQASTQLLNKDVAAHIAKFTSPFNNNGIDRKKADSVFYDAMVLSPSAEVYFLDTTGKVIAYHANKSDIKEWNVPLGNIHKLINSKGTLYIKSVDPKQPADDKIFSAAEVSANAKKLGYIYVILGSNEKVTGMLYNGFLGNLLAKAICVIIILSIILTVVYLNRLQKTYNHIVVVLKKFEAGDMNARFQLKEEHELTPITTAFNKMADQLVYNISRLTKSENERKDFIANISHDLRTPLAVARGYTETLMINADKKVIPPQQQHEYMHLIISKIEQVEHMVNQLFELSKMESVELVPEKEPFIFSEILNENIHASGAAITAKNIALKCVDCEDATWINADVRMMERVIQNLLNNAINYTPVNGDIIISLVKKNNNLIFKIKNSGKALSNDVLNWLNTSEDKNPVYSKPEKSGFGLMIVKKILSLHHYSLFAKATADTSNSFAISMPIYNSFR